LENTVALHTCNLLEIRSQYTKDAQKVTTQTNKTHEQVGLTEITFEQTNHKVYPIKTEIYQGAKCNMVLVVSLSHQHLKPSSF